MAEKPTSSSPPEDKESSPCQLEGIILCGSNCTLNVMRHVYSNVGGSRKRPDQPCSSSSLQSKRSRENNDIGGEYSSPCSPFLIIGGGMVWQVCVCVGGGGG